MAFVVSFGSYVPERIVGNEELSDWCGVSAEWIVERCGIQERRYAADTETVSSVALLAARDCLRRSGAAPTDLGAVLVASGSAERFSPGPAGAVAAELGCTGVLALDIPVASAGSLIGLGLAAQLAEKLGKVLVIGAEIMSRRVDRTPEGRNTAVLFGDGAGAALLDASAGPLRVADFELHTDGNHADVLKMENERLVMDGPTVIGQVSRKLPGAVKALLERQGIAAAEVSAVVMHQANLVLIGRVAKAVGILQDRFFVNIERYGNTSSASLLIAAAEWWESIGQKASGPVALAAFGAGLNWGAMLLQPA